MKPKISVIGGEGFIGKYICQRLAEQGGSFKSLDIKTGFDVRDESMVKKAIKNSDLIFNLASVAGVDNVEKDPFGCIETNVIGVRNILKYKKGKLVYFSTSEVYGKIADQNLESDSLLVEPPTFNRWGYQASKLCAEHLIMISDPNSLIIRPFNVYGKGQSPVGAVAKFVNWATKNEDIKINNTGNEIRSWICIDDFVDGVFALVDNQKKGIYNIGGEDLFTTQKLAKTIVEITKSKSKLIFGEFTTDVYYRQPNIDKIKKETEWKPKRKFEGEIRKLVL